MKKLSCIKLLLLFHFIIGVSLVSGEERHAWPVIQSVEKNFYLRDHENTGLGVTIAGTDGKPLYLLECYLNAYDQTDRNFDYTGDFECRLTSLYSQEGYGTLLTEEKNSTRDWQSRGRFLMEELTRKCPKNLQCQLVEHFKLRGMDLTIEIENYKIEVGSAAQNVPWKRDRVKELECKIAVTPNPTVTSEIAERERK